VTLYDDEPGAIVARRALQLALPRDLARFAKIAASGLFEPGSLEMLTPAQTAARLGEQAPGSLEFHDGLVIEPNVILAAWAPEVRKAAVARIERDSEGWRLLGATGAVLASAEAVVVAAGLASAELVAGCALSAVRGQASWAPLDDAPPAAAFGGYAIPMRDGVLFGATNDRDDVARDVRAEDHRRNLAALAQGLPQLAGRLAGRRLEGRASIRVATADFLPMAGAAPQGPAGLFVLAGFGARGFTLAPLLAEHVAALALQAPSPLPGPLARIVEPGRFGRRAARRAPRQPGSASVG
jgi:tRNA 5-methylaminomethyl-2-thiouridine biosynthesis bifunctional protein